jgi:ATP-binding cassette subfamily B protein
MLKSLRIIAGDLKNLYGLTILNALHLLLRGIPFGILFLVILELLKDREAVSVSRLAALFIFMAVTMILNTVFAIRVHVRGYLASFSMTTDARLRLGDHLRTLPLGFFKNRDPGDISCLLMQDMARVEGVLSNVYMDAMACLILPAMLLTFFFMADSAMSSLILISVIFAFIVLFFSQRIIFHFGKRQIASRNITISKMLEYLQGMQVLKAFSLTGKNFSRLDAIMRRLRNDSIKLEGAGGAPVVAFSTLLEVGFACLLVFGAWLLSEERIDVPVFVLFLVIGHKFYEPLLNYGLLISEMRYMSIAAERITSVLQTRPLSESSTPQLPERYDISFSNVTFSYLREKNVQKVLDAVTFSIPQGSMTALVGPSGSGKTTVTSLMVRFWDVDAGNIAIGGVDIKNIPAEHLNSLFSVVFQDVYLFQDTVANNIRVGKKDASMEEIVVAAKAARCHEFIEKMPDGYDSRIGEGGATLSGGEKQRLSIARAFLKNAPIVILDEATASLDPENERLIQQAISAIVRNKTVVVIAHRLKTVTRADQILVLEKGAVSEAGKHEQLLGNKALYSRLWAEQQRAGGWKFRR